MQTLSSKTTYSFFKLLSLPLQKLIFRLQNAIIFSLKKNEIQKMQKMQLKTSSVNILIYSLSVEGVFMCKDSFLKGELFYVFS